jgi:hypothetical protein
LAGVRVCVLVCVVLCGVCVVCAGLGCALQLQLGGLSTSTTPALQHPHPSVHTHTRSHTHTQTHTHTHVTSHHRPLLHALLLHGIAAGYGVELDSVKVSKAAAFCKVRRGRHRRHASTRAWSPGVCFQLPKGAAQAAQRLRRRQQGALFMFMRLRNACVCGAPP